MQQNVLFLCFQSKIDGHRVHAEHSRESQRHTDHKQSGHVDGKRKITSQTTDKRFHQGARYKGEFENNIIEIEQQRVWIVQNLAEL